MTPALSEGSLLEQFLTWLAHSRGNSPATIETYGRAIRDFERRMGCGDPRTVTIGELDRYMSRLALAGRSENTRRNRATALRTFLAYLTSRGVLESNPAKDLEGPRARVVERLPTFTPAEIESLLSVPGFLAPRGRREPLHIFDQRRRIFELKELRDPALLGLVYSLGLRASEPGRLRRTDYGIERGIPVLTIRSSKHSREPVTFRVDRHLAAELDTYLAELRRHRRGSESLFPPLVGNSADGISPDQLTNVLKKRARLADLDRPGRRISPHVLRYSIASHLHEQRIPLREIQAHLRHRSIETTARYIRLGSFASIQKRVIRALPWNSRRLGSSVDREQK